MSVHPGRSSPRVSGMPGQPVPWAGYMAAGAAAATALLYLLMGTVGSTALGFSLAMGAIFALVTVLLIVSGQLSVWIPVAVLDLGAIIGYFAVAGTRAPHFEAWGLGIKAAQVVLLAAVGYLIINDRRAAGRR